MHETHSLVGGVILHKRLSIPASTLRFLGIFEVRGEMYKSKLFSEMG